MTQDGKIICDVVIGSMLWTQIKMLANILSEIPVWVLKQWLRKRGEYIPYE